MELGHPGGGPVLPLVTPVTQPRTLPVLGQATISFARPALPATSTAPGAPIALAPPNVLTPPEPAVVEVWGTHQVEVPAEIVPQLMGTVLGDVKQRAGGDISINLLDPTDQALLRTVLIQGPKVSASLGACLLLQRVTELI